MMCVNWFVEGRSAWKQGIIGFFSRLRGILLTGAVAVGTMGLPWWWPSAMPPTVTVKTTTVIVAAASLAGGLSVGGFVYLRRRAKRSLEIKCLLHDFAHYLRDHATKMHKRDGQKNTDREEVVLESFSEYMDHICEYIRDHFTCMTHDSTINCAVRVAVEVDGEGGTKRVVYRTVGRSSGLSRDRASTTEDIPANQGIPRYLHERECKGVLRYNDIEEASDLRVFHPTTNERIYSNEITTMMVAPINGWDGKKTSMLGLLYVTSRNERVFFMKHVDCVRFAADTIAQSLSFTVQSIKDGGVAGTIRRCQ